MPFGNMNGRPSGHLFYGLSTWNDGLHQDHPAKNQLMPTFPGTGHPFKKGNNKPRQTTIWDHGIFSFRLPT